MQKVYSEKEKHLYLDKAMIFYLQQQLLVYFSLPALAKLKSSYVKAPKTDSLGLAYPETEGKHCTHEKQITAFASFQPAHVSSENMHSS